MKTKPIDLHTGPELVADNFNDAFPVNTLDGLSAVDFDFINTFDFFAVLPTIKRCPFGKDFVTVDPAQTTV